MISTSGGKSSGRSDLDTTDNITTDGCKLCLFRANKSCPISSARFTEATTTAILIMRDGSIQETIMAAPGIIKQFVTPPPARFTRRIVVSNQSQLCYTVPERLWTKSGCG